jgi:uncharacterized membrane protein YphA (DoxX/SURF4 family)
LTALRIVIGWHFLYEGLFKIDSGNGAATHQTSRFVIESSTARLKAWFAQTPADQLKLDPALAQVDAWHDGIVKAFAAQKALAEDQKARLADLRDKVKIAAADAVRGRGDPARVIDFHWTFVHEEVLKVSADPEGEAFTSLAFLQTAAGPFRGLFRGLVPDMNGLARLTPASAHARLDQRYDAIVRHYGLTPEQRSRLAAVRDELKDHVARTLADPVIVNRLADYREMLERVHQDASRGNAPFTSERLDADRKKLDTTAAELLAFVDEPVAELDFQAQTIATPTQIGLGPIPLSRPQTWWIDVTIQFVLTGIGLCLLLGLFTPVAAIAAAAQLLVFYLASPPFPGLPGAAMAGHYLFVDRNLIEAVAALVIAATHAGQWAGLDFYIDMFRRRRVQPNLQEVVS